jgi:hypothetical protein
MKPLPCRSSCKIGSRTDIIIETFAIGFLMRLMKTELNKEKQEVLIIYTHKYNFTSDTLNNRVATIVSSNVY